ncbi:hypothetical protein [Paraburkholderia sp. JHI869]|uniref:hypothetical protein n=1 Tax=Paraburkholderia sp. JHI869 TaxID=3112959 RepID=UPI00317D84D5
MAITVDSEPAAGPQMASSAASDALSSPRCATTGCIAVDEEGRTWTTIAGDERVTAR